MLLIKTKLNLCSSFSACQKNFALAFRVALRLVFLIFFGSEYYSGLPTSFYVFFYIFQSFDNRISVKCFNIMGVVAVKSTCEVLFKNINQTVSFLNEDK